MNDELKISIITVAFNSEKTIRDTIKSIVNQDVRDKVVIVRADLNIPITNGIIQDYSRITRLVPTIDYLVKSGSKVVICSHLGRPNGKFNKELSLKPLVEILSQIIKTKVHFLL